ncbi:nuclear transport factor 2 family protein [Gramella sp. KN1008]|uniref:nuclear transport factor 2 family protein n=1 Tax=Gramella sp. KN1008 TaxID=2529298 RepID=UPI00103CB9A6|nr:nuclear transport factor 2 family protein [Gramella sp. KN1008]TBW29174.1 nuclear transport factor 2 family protein [Gramella sp. KN1008]
MANRKEFVKKINKAFASCNTEFISKSVTDEIEWIIVGEKTIAGREAFEDALERMKLGGPMQINLVDIITEEDKTVVEGIVEMEMEPGKVKKYAFCDIYIFQDTKSNKFKELRTYISAIKKKK